MKSDKKEVYAIVADVLPQGRGDASRPTFKHEPLVLAIGVEQFKLLELVPKTPDIGIGEKVYIGDGERKKIERVKRRISYEELSISAKKELPYIVEEIVNDNEPRFIDFFNRAVPITPKLHMLSLLPGIGKKLMWEVIEQREKKPFTGYEDIRERIKSMPHPERLVMNRIMEELMNPDVKYHIFTSK